MAGKALSEFPIHLGRAGLAMSEPSFAPEMSWFVDYSARHARDGVEGRLISEYVFTENWQSWERHPSGGEVVYCLSGKMTLHQELANGRIEKTVLEAGQYAINPPGVWHTADVDGEARALFITAGAGTQHRPR